MINDMKTINLFYIGLTAADGKESQLFEYNEPIAAFIFSN